MDSPRYEEYTAESREITKQYKRIITLLPASTRDRVLQIAPTLDAQSISSEEHTSVVSKAVKRRFGNLSAMDIEVLVALVMFELWQSEEEALGELMEEMRRINETKRRHRERIEFLKKKKREATSVREGLPGSSLFGPSVPRLKPNPRLKPKKYYLGQDGDRYTDESLHSKLNELKGKLDGMNEMSDMTSLRLQMTMDRRSKFISTLSMMMKKISTTQDRLVQNLK